MAGAIRTSISKLVSGGFGADETEYDDYDPMGITMPVRKMEWVSLRLVHMENGKLCYGSVSLSENVLYRRNLSADDIIKYSIIEFPTMEELLTTEFVEACLDGGENVMIPSIHYEVFTVDGMYKKWEAPGQLAEFFRKDFSLYSKFDIKNKFIMMSENCPGEFFEVNTKFEKDLSKVLFCYNAVGAMEYHASIHKEALQTFFHFLNDSCDLTRRDLGYTRRSEPKVTFAPKFYVEKERVTMILGIPNPIWARNQSDTSWYLLEYCKLLFERLCPLFNGILDGSMEPSKAMEKVREIPTKI